MFCTILQNRIEWLESKEIISIIEMDVNASPTKFNKIKSLGGRQYH